MRRRRLHYVPQGAAFAGEAPTVETLGGKPKHIAHLRVAWIFVKDNNGPRSPQDTAVSVFEILKQDRPLLA